MSRDELRTRSAALPPSLQRSGEACWPTDPDGGGTWIGATGHGLTLGLLNVNLGVHEPPSSGTRTRGEIIPSLASCPDAATAASELLGKNLTRYRPFRLVAVDATSVIDLRWDRHRLIETPRRLAPACFVSSGLGDHVVEPRLMLFDSIFSVHSATPEMQDGFHQHVWPKHEHLSVMMSRELARTTCVTTVETRRARAGETAVAMRYTDDDGVSEPVELGGLVAAAC